MGAGGTVNDGKFLLYGFCFKQTHDQVRLKFYNSGLTWSFILSVVFHLLFLKMFE